MNLESPKHTPVIKVNLEIPKRAPIQGEISHFVPQVRNRHFLLPFPRDAVTRSLEAGLPEGFTEDSWGEGPGTPRCSPRGQELPEGRNGSSNSESLGFPNHKAGRETDAGRDAGNRRSWLLSVDIIRR